MAAYTIAQLKSDVSAGHIDTVVCAFPDMQGRLTGKRFQAEYFLEGALDETHGCDYLLANDIDMEPVPGYEAANWEKGYGDFVLKPDVATLMKCTWLEGTALILCDLVDHHHHEPIPHSPRAMLKAQLARLEKLGLTANFASELEFYLFDETYRSAYDKGYRNMTTAGYYIEDYHIFQTTKEEGVMRAIRNGLQGAGIPVENTKGEASAGQGEVNVRYADALTMADRHVIIKNACKEIAWSRGKSITFLAKWNAKAAGSSSHIHQSLWSADGRTPKFLDQNAEYSMSPLMRHYVAGLLAHASEITVFLAPYINSYKRFQNATFAPTKLIWSRDNRTAGFRLCGEGTSAIRNECRMGGADLNPYLAFAALLAAGMKGIEDKLTLGDPFVGDAYGKDDLTNVPRTLRAATETMKASKFLRETFGDGVVDHYVHTAEWEQFEYDRRITDWELMRGFERY